MDSNQFLRASNEVSTFITHYLKDVKEKPVVPKIQPGFLKHQIPLNPPNEPENWEDILNDFQKKIIPGMTHWQHPGFFAYFPAGNSYPSILADMLSDGLGCVGFSWAANPSCTELETIMMDWLARMLHLPKSFIYHEPGSNGGGVIQGSASQCILVSMLSARNRALNLLKTRYPMECPGSLLYKLVVYCSNLAHSAVHKASTIAYVNLRNLKTDARYSLRGKELEEAIKEDLENGYFPFMIIGTLGTTSCCSFDNVRELGEIAQKYNLWFHVDAAYAGSAFICPEFKHLQDGLELVDSFNTNPNKWMLTCFDCSAYWVKNREFLIEAMTENPIYLQHKNSDCEEAIDYRNWDIALSRRFRSLKLWFVIRSYGITGLQSYIRNHVKLAKLMERLIRQDVRFEIYGEVVMGLVCFRLKGSNSLNKRLLEILNETGKIHMVPSLLEKFDSHNISTNKKFDEYKQLSDDNLDRLNDDDKSAYVIRFAVCRENATGKEIHEAWDIITGVANRLLLVLSKRVSMIDELFLGTYTNKSCPKFVINGKYLKPNHNLRSKNSDSNESLDMEINRKTRGLNNGSERKYSRDVTLLYDPVPGDDFSKEFSEEDKSASNVINSNEEDSSDSEHDDLSELVRLNLFARKRSSIGLMISNKPLYEKNLNRLRLLSIDSSRRASG